MRLQRRHIIPLIAAVFIIATAQVSFAQSWEFHKIPVNNACLGWSIQPLFPIPPCPGLGPGGSAVYNCSLSGMLGLRAFPPYVGYYTPTAPWVIDPPRICSFNTCTTASIKLTCFRPSFDGNGVAVTDVQSLELKRVAELPPPPEQPNPGQ